MHVTIEFTSGSHIHSSAIEAANIAKLASIKFNWNGDTYKFPKGVAAQDILQEFAKRTGRIPVLSEDERRQLKEHAERRRTEDFQKYGQFIHQASVHCPATCQEAIELWDARHFVPTIEMGGIGFGYELAIQSLMFETMRELLPKRSMLRCIRGWWQSRMGLQTTLRCISSEQVAAATELAVRFIACNNAHPVDGYSRHIHASPAGRRIAVKKPA